MKLFYLLGFLYYFFEVFKFWIVQFLQRIFKLLRKFAEINIHRLEKGIFYYRTVRHVDEKSVYKT